MRKIFKSLQENRIYIFVSLGFLIIASELSSPALYILTIVMIAYIAFKTNL